LVLGETGHGLSRKPVPPPGGKIRLFYHTVASYRAEKEGGTRRSSEKGKKRGGALTGEGRIACCRRKGPQDLRSRSQRCTGSRGGEKGGKTFPDQAATEGETGGRKKRALPPGGTPQPDPSRSLKKEFVNSNPVLPRWRGERAREQGGEGTPS